MVEVRNMAKFRIFIILFLLLCIISADSLFAPPFWDDIIGVHNQAVWLGQHDFNIAVLAKMSKESGSACYNLVNPLCYLYGICYKFLPPDITHFCSHLVNIASIAGCGTLLLLMLAKSSLPDRMLYLAGALSCPLIIAACCSTGQESPLAFMIMLSFYFHFRRRKRAAWITGIIACCFKLTAVVLIFAYGAESLLRALRNRKIFSVRNFFILFAFAICVAAYLFHFSHISNHFKVKTDEWLSLFCNAYYLLLPIFLISVIILKKFSSRYIYFLPVGLFLLFYYIANAVSGMVSLPRYGIIIVFPTIFLFASSVKYLSSFKRKAAVLAVIALGLCNIYGYFLPEPGALLLHDGSFMERSREFTVMRSSDREFCAAIEKEFHSSVLICAWPMLHMLTVPEFGYVKKSLKNVYAGEYSHCLGNVRKMSKETLQLDPIFIFTPDCYNWRIPAGAEIVWCSNRRNPLSGYLLYRLPSLSRSSSMR